jgi:hypothetical protein
MTIFHTPTFEPYRSLATVLWLYLITLFAGEKVHQKIDLAFYSNSPAKS